MHVDIIVCAKIIHPFGFSYRMILSCHMVRHKIDDNLHASHMCASQQLLKLSHSSRHILGEIGVDVIIVADGVG